MSFDKKVFLKAKLEPRVEAVSVPDLKIFFKEGTEPLWKVRNLSGHELGMINEAAARAKALSAVLDGIISTDSREQVEAIKASLGLNDDTPADIVRRIEMLKLGSVDPAIDQETAVKICTHYPVVFFELTQKITALTGLGAEVKKKPSASGVMPE